jgi:hypothetical protein
MWSWPARRCPRRWESLETGAGGRSATMDVGRTQRGGFSATCLMTNARKTCGRGMLIRGVEIALLAGLHAGQQGTQCG